MTPTFGEWLDIDSAPRDGSQILVIEPKNGGQRRIVQWEPAWTWVSVPGRITVRPTHWMPLPRAPLVKGSACCSPASAATNDGNATDRSSSGASLGRGLAPEVNLRDPLAGLAEAFERRLGDFEMEPPVLTAAKKALRGLAPEGDKPTSGKRASVDGLREMVDLLLQQRGKPILAFVRERDRDAAYQVGLMLDELARALDINSPSLPHVPIAPWCPEGAPEGERRPPTTEQA